MKTIFVSSTFKDMHYERDAIRDITAPFLNEEAKKHGDELDFCDLRWGINTGDLDTEEGSRKVLDVCLDEIDRSEPPMVVLLGYRYGWIPDAGLIKTAADRKQLELEDLEKSVTALEIEYGALCDEKKFGNTLFYFREIEGGAPSDYLAEDGEHEEKISTLKNRIKSIAGGKVKEYTLKWNGSGFDGVEDFAQMLADDIKDMLMREWLETESLTDFERERRTHAAFIREKNVMFRARQAEAEKLMEDALSQPVTIIKGEVGSGKSTLFCHMAAELGKSRWTVLPFISGLTTQSSSARDIIEDTVYFIEKELRLDHYIDEADSQTHDIDNDEDDAASRTNKKKVHTPDEWREKLAEMCSAYAETGARLLIMVDAADQLAQSEERDKLHFIPLSVSEDIHFVMTCTTDFKTPFRKHHTLQQLNNEDKLDVVNGILARYGREISQPVIDRMLELKASDNPLYLSLLVQRLLMMNREDFADIRSRGDGMAAIEQHQLELIRDKCPDGLDEMSAALLSEAGKRINEKLASKAAQYLAVSRNGLRRKDMAALLGGEWTEVGFSHFVSYMSDCFLLRDDGRYDFTHKSIRAGFRGRCEDPDGVNRDILEYFKSLEADDPVRMSEITYHAVKADDKKFFVDYISGSIMEHESASHLISHAARDIYTQCVTDNGQWVIDVLHKAKRYEADDKLCNLTHFCNYDLNDAFGGSQKELEIRLSILTANTDFSEYLYHKLKSNESKMNLSISYQLVAKIYRALGGTDNLLHALELHEKGLSISEQLAGELDTAENKRYLSIGYDNGAQIYMALDGTDNLLHALELHEKGLTISEQLAKELGTALSKRDLFVSYYNAAVIYEKLGGTDNLLHALALNEKSLSINEQLAEESGTTESKRHLSLSYNHIAQIYRTLGGTDNLLHALALNEKGLSISEQLAEESGTTESKRNLSLSYNHVAQIYMALGGTDNLLHALALLKKSLAINKRLAEELGTAESKRELSISYDGVAIIYVELDDTDHLLHALALFKKSRTIREQLAEELGTAQSKRELSTSYNHVATIYKELGGTDHLLHALALLKKSLAINKRLAEELGTSESKRDLSISYDAVARIYVELDDTDHLLHALALFKKSRTILEQLAEELGTSESKRELSISYNNVAMIYEELGGSHNLKSALELYGKSLTIMERLAEDLGTVRSKGDLSISYNHIAGIYKELGGIDNLLHALDLYGKSLTIMERLAEELGTSKSKRELSISYNNVAGIYEELGGSDDLMHALDLYGKSLTIMERLVEELGTSESKRELSISYDHVAGIYKELGGIDNLLHALDLYGKSLTIREQMAEELNTSESKRELSISYYNVAIIYEELGGSDDLMHALDLYGKSLTIRERLAEELGTSESKRELSISYNNVAKIYKELGGSDHLKRALELYEKALPISEQMAEELGTVVSKRYLSLNYDIVAEIYEVLGGSGNLQRALELYHKALAIRETLADTLQTPDAYDDLVECLLKTARHPSTSTSDKKAILTRGLELSKELYEKTGLDKYQSYIEECEALLRSC